MKCKKLLFSFLFLGLLLFFVHVVPTQDTSHQKQGWNSNGNLMQSELNSQMQQNGYNNSTEIMNVLLQLFSDQSSDLKSLRFQWQNLINLVSTFSTASKNETYELKNLLTNSGEIIKNLEQNLKIAIDRINDAESGALNLLNENISLFNENVTLKKAVLNKNNMILKMAIVIIILSIILILIIAVFIFKIIYKVKTFAIFKPP